jgi:hypothetical protein
MNPSIIKDPLLYPGCILPDATISFFSVYTFCALSFKSEVIVSIGIYNPPKVNASLETFR